MDQRGQQRQQIGLMRSNARAMMYARLEQAGLDPMARHQALMQTVRELSSDPTAMATDPELIPSLLQEAEALKAPQPPAPVAAGAGTMMLDPTTGQPVSGFQVPFKPGPETVVNVTNMGEERETEFAKNLGKHDADLFKARIESRDRASAALPQYARIEAAIKSGRFQPGAFAEQRQFLSTVAELFGASGEDIGLGLGAAETADTIEAASAQLASVIAEDMGRNTNMALSQVLKSVPQLTRTAEGNMILVEVGRHAARRARQVADLQERYLQQYGTMRPKDAPSIEQAIAQLDETDPVLPAELISRIEQKAKSAPERKLGGIPMAGSSILPPEPIQGAPPTPEAPAVRPGKSDMLARIRAAKRVEDVPPPDQLQTADEINAAIAKIQQLTGAAPNAGR